MMLKAAGDRRREENVGLAIGLRLQERDDRKLAGIELVVAHHPLEAVVGGGRPAEIERDNGGADPALPQRLGDRILGEIGPQLHDAAQWVLHTIAPLSQRFKSAAWRRAPACTQRWRLAPFLVAPTARSLRSCPPWRFGDPGQPAASWPLTSLVDQAWIERLRSAGEDPFLILRAHRGERLARHAQELGERASRGRIVGAPGKA